MTAEPACPQCGGRIAYDLTCHTWSQRRDDGRETFMSCLPCDSAIEYFCTEWLKDDPPPDECGWRYTHGLNSRNPRSAENEQRRPAWLPPDFPLVQGPLRLVTAFPGVPLHGTQE